MQSLLLIGLVIAVHMTASGATHPQGPFTSARAILNLTREAAAQAHPVEIRGVVMSNNGSKGVFVHDHSAGIYVSIDGANAFIAGDAIAVLGKTNPGGYLPNVKASSVSRFGRLPLPRARPISYEELSRPHIGGSYVEVVATVRSVAQMPEAWAVMLHSKGVRTLLEVHSAGGEGRPQPGDVVRVRGALGSYFNANGQWLGPKLHVQTFASVAILQGADSKAGQLPLTRMSDFLRHRPGINPVGRTRIRGTVTCLRPEGVICLQEGDRGLMAQGPLEREVRVGDAVEVTGFPTFDRYSPRLEDTQVRRVGEGHPLKSAPISAEQARSGSYDGRLVELSGTLVIVERNRMHSAGPAFEKTILTIAEGSQTFNAELAQAGSFKAPQPGSKIRVTGVCRVVGSPPMALKDPTFSVILRNASDIEVLEDASWWTSERTRTALVSLAAAITLSLAGLVVLRRKVRRQTAIIRDQLHLETALEERYRDLIENATDLVFTVDVHGLLLSANKAAQNTFGIGEAEVGGTPVHRFIAPNDRPVFSDVLALLIGGERTILRHVSLEMEDGRACVIEMNCRVRHVDGNPSFVEIIGRDVTQQKREQAALESARAAAEAASRAKSDFLANMSHEIRTPMNGILGMTELTLQGSLQPDQRANLEVVRTSSEALVAIINDVLDFSNLDLGRIELQHAPFDILPLAGSCLDLIALPAAQKRIHLVCDVDPTLPAEWIGDAARLRQVLVNLVGNAAKFTEAGEIVLRIDRVDASDGSMQARFTVQDTGIGVPAEHQKRIFEMFAQADGSFSRKYGGAGLGLAMASRLVAAMGGALTLASTPGVGSSFEFTIRVEAQDHRPIVPAGLYSGRTAAVLVKNVAARGSIERVLRQIGMVIVEEQTASLIVAEEPMLPVQSPVIHLRPPGRRNEDYSPAGALICEPVIATALLPAIESALSGAAPLPAFQNVDNLPETPAVALPAAGAQAAAIILLAEDNKVNQMLALRTLEKAGYRVVVANNGREAVELMREVNAGVVLMDIQMPEMDGFQATAKIREWSSVPVIAMTAHALKGDRERCLKEGMTDYISKPIRPPALLQVVGRYVPVVTPVA